MSDVHQVMIIGGGHVGLSFALLLAYHGIFCTLIEKNTYPAISPSDDTAYSHYLDCRNTALSRRTVEIYREIGLWDSLISHACQIDRVLIKEQGGFGSASLHKEAEKVESFGQVMENAWLGRQLLMAVQASEYVELIDGATVTGIKEDSTQAIVTYERDGVAHTLNAPIVVACDGQHSVARQLLGVGAKTHDYGQVAIVGAVETTKPHAHTAVEYFTKQGLLAVLPLGDDAAQQAKGTRRSVVWVCKQGEEERYLTDDGYFLGVLTQTFGREAGQFINAGKRQAYPLAKVIAERQVIGRTVLMGNAAHTLHPVAAQGFNLCMRDAYALAKLLKTAKDNNIDFGDHANLLSYENARHTDQKRVMAFCDAVVYGFTHQNPVVKFGRNLGLIAFDKVPYVKPMVARFAMGLDF